MGSVSPSDGLLTLPKNLSKTELSSPTEVSASHSPSFRSVQVSPQHKAVAEATNKEGQQVHGGDDGERGGPVTIIAVGKRRGRGGGGGGD